jgi:sugar lactone lactonase YvrE
MWILNNRILRPALALPVLLVTTLALQGQTFTFSTIAGTAGATGTNDGIGGEARFKFPAGITADAQGTLYVADFLNHAIRKMTRSGTNWTVATIAGLPGAAGDYADGTNAGARFNRPSGIAVDSEGNLFVAERYNHVIRKVSPVGTNWVTTTIAGLAPMPGDQDGTNSEARFYLPSAVAVDASNHLYVADTSNFTIREITPNGTNWIVSTIAGTPLNYGFADGTNLDAAFNYPYGLTVSHDGTIYVADWGNNAIREMSRVGLDWVVSTVAGFTTNAGSADGPGAVATFNNPTTVAVDTAGNLYVTDQRNNTIRKIVPGSNGWTVSTVGGQAGKKGSVDGVGTNALLATPWGLVVDASGTLLVADYGNSIIRSGVSSGVPPPSLSISLAGAQIVLSWPLSAADFVLQKATNQGASIDWRPLTNGIATNDNLLVLTNTIDSPTAFYRLRR